MTRPRVVVRRTGARSHPWEARCTACTATRLHLLDGIGAVAVNTRGLGNRLWILALAAAWAHLRWHDDGCPTP